MKLTDEDEIVTVYAEHADGPGWSNSPVWVIVRRHGQLREECLQPEEQSGAVLDLYDISAAVHRAMRAAVAALRARESCAPRRLLEEQPPPTPPHVCSTDRKY